MSDEDALLAAITANPDEDTPRLVYADWLDENGDADRAEFIRLQIARQSLHPGPPRIQPSFARECELLARNHDEWMKPLFPWVGGRPGMHFRRGFLDELICATERFLQHPASLLQLAPLSTIVLGGVEESHLQGLADIKYPPSVRIRLAGFGGLSQPVELLTSRPCGPHSPLLQGRWLILMIRPERSLERWMAVRYLRARKAEWFRELPIPGFALNSFQVYAGSGGWGDWLDVTVPTPRWIWLENGRLSEHEGGYPRPNSLPNSRRRR